MAYSTVREFYSILEDTLMGFLLYPYLKSIRKRMSQSPKFYFFDNGVTRAILGSLRNPPNFLEKGRLFEQWFIQEVDRINKYFSKDWKLFFWRTSHGAEVDLVIEQAGKMICAIECKCKQTLSRADLSGLHSILEEQPKIPCYIVAPIKTPLKIDTVNVLPPFEMLKRLKE
ncbi:MAG: DUF4143 domain-containing protein [Chlamydiae bacterium]|nr:DUF4143 domain-containing protein [Chlamydiota bacterium]